MDMGYNGRQANYGDSYDVLMAVTGYEYLEDIDTDVFEKLAACRPAMFRMEYVGAVALAIVMLKRYKSITLGESMPLCCR